MRNVVRWRIASQSHGGAYVVVGLGCPCQDSRAKQQDGSMCCKHSIAVASYMPTPPSCQRLTANQAL
jgi:hypothetical protein